MFQTNDAQILDGGLNDIRIISCVTVCLLLGVAIIGTEWETKVFSHLIILRIYKNMSKVVYVLMSQT